MRAVLQEGGGKSRIPSRGREMAGPASARRYRSVIVLVRGVSSGLISMIAAPFFLERRGISHAGATCAEVPITRRTPQLSASDSASSWAFQGIGSPNRAEVGFGN